MLECQKEGMDPRNNICLIQSLIFLSAASGDKNCLTDYLILHGGHCKVSYKHKTMIKEG